MSNKPKNTSSKKVKPKKVALPPRWLEKAAIECLEKNPNVEFRTRDIAEWIFKNYNKQCNQKVSLKKFGSDSNLMIRQIRGEIISATEYITQEEPCIKIIKGNPRYFYYETEQGIEAEEGSAIAQATHERDDEQYDEEALYMPLCEFLYSELDVYCRYINHKKSPKQKRGKNKWLHPDIVGVEVPKWNENVKSCASEFTNSKPDLWSFEVKKEIEVGSIREIFPQTIANSSWANIGYLVVAEIKKEHRSHVMRELRMLSKSHGIGCILLNKENPTESHIIIPARRRADINWYFVNRLATENKDFLEYVKSIERISKGERVCPLDWDYDSDWDQ